MAAFSVGSADGKTKRRPRAAQVLFFVFVVRLLGGALLERGAQDVAERGAGIRRAVLGDRLFLLGYFERLDGDRDLAGTMIELRHARVDLLSHREPLGPLL